MLLRVLLCGFAISLVVSAEFYQELADDCGGTYNTTNGNFSSPVKDPGANQTCTWYIKTDKTSPSVTVQLTRIDFSGGHDQLTVVAGDGNTSSVITTFANTSVPGPVLVISPAQVTKIIFQRGSGNMTAKFSATFNTVNCSQDISAQQGVINSPVYLNGTGEVTCTYNVAVAGNKDVVLLSMKEFSLPNGTLEVTFQNTTTPLSGEENQVDLFGAAGTQSFTLKLSLKNDPRPQKFTALFSTVNKDCSGKFDKGNSLSLPVTQFPTTCHAQFVAKANQTVYVSSGNRTTQSVLLYDGGSVNAPQIGDFRIGSWYGSSGQTLTLIANRDSSSSATTVTYKQADRSFYSIPLGKNVSLQLKTDASGDQATKSVQFLTDKNIKLNIVFNKASKLSDNATVILQDGGDNAFGTPIFSFRADTPFFPVISPTNRLIVVVKSVTGDNVADITVTAAKSGCSQVYTASPGQISWGHDKTDTQCTLGIINSSSTPSTDVVTFEVNSLTLCANCTLSVYKGFKKTAPLLATYNSTSAPVLTVRFPASEGAKIVWSGAKSTKAETILSGNYWTQSAGAACGGDFSNATSGTITSPGFPATYPLNTHCRYPFKDVANSSLYITLNSIQLDAAHSLNLTKNGTVVRQFRNSTSPFRPLAVDAIIPTGNLVLDFDATKIDGTVSQKPNAGYSLSFRFLTSTCGGVVTSLNDTITSPVNVTQSTECIWIIQLKKDGAKKSVNVVHASISVNGLSNKTKNVLEVRDGGSARDALVKKENYTDFLSRTNFLWIRYYIDISNTSVGVQAPTAFTFKLNYTQHNCNSSSLCANGECLLPNWRCNGINDCGDWSDESNCPYVYTTTAAPSPAPHGGSKGVKAYWIVICLILGVILGMVLVCVVPAIYRRLKYPHYSHLRDSLSPSEA